MKTGNSPFSIILTCLFACSLLVAAKAKKTDVEPGSAAIERVKSESGLSQKAGAKLSKKTKKGKKTGKKKKTLAKKKSVKKVPKTKKLAKKPISEERLKRLQKIARAKKLAKIKNEKRKKVARKKKLNRKKAKSHKMPAKLVTSAKSIKPKKPKKNWGINLRYGVSTDFTDDVEPRLYNHSMGVRGSYRFLGKYSTSLGFGMRYVSAGDVVRVDNNDRDFSAGISNINLGLSFPIMKKDKSYTWSGSAGYVVPTSETAQYEGYKGIVSGSTSVSLPFFDGIYSMSHSLSSSYIINTFEYSPVSDAINSDLSTSYSFGNSFKLGLGFRFSLSFGIDATHYLDSSWIYSYNNGASLSYSIQAFSASLSFRNGSYADDPGVTLWFVDQYRQIFRFGMGYSF